MSMLQVNGVSLFYSVKGEGVPIVFIHPPVLTSDNFIYQKNELSRYFKTITFDIRGHGKSDFSPAPLSYPLIAEDIMYLLDHLGIEKAFLCGYSTGGSIVLECLLNYPKRCIGGIVVSGMSEAYGTLKDKITVGKCLAEQDAVLLIALSVSRSNSNNKQLYERLFKSAIKGDRRNIEQYYAYSLEYNCTARLDSIHHPVLLVYGQKDKQFHPYAKLLYKKLPNNELKFIDHVKHQLPTKAAEELNERIKQFVNEHKKSDN
jgi:pimeloyl-ACP methyl ester carboxylesterase